MEGMTSSQRLAERIKQQAHALGFELAAMGPTQLAARAVPVLLQAADPAALALAVLAELREHGVTQLLNERRNELLAMHWEQAAELPRWPRC